jgi:hypothetical protein
VQFYRLLQVQQGRTYFYNLFTLAESDELSLHHQQNNCEMSGQLPLHFPKVSALSVTACVV